MAEAKLAPSLPQWMIDHANRYISSGGKEGHIYTVTPPGYSEMHVPSLLLTTTGRKSGEKYIFPLFYGEDGSSYIVVASKGGAPEHPNWYRNLVANPEVEVQVGTKKLTAKARTATGAERDKLWEKALKFWPPYADYAKKTERQIPVVVLDPVGRAADKLLSTVGMRPSFLPRAVIRGYRLSLLTASASAASESNSGSNVSCTT